jgi:uncharacterized protein YlxW (UPF0749 family)
LDKLAEQATSAQHVLTHVQSSLSHFKENLQSFDYAQKLQVEDITTLVDNAISAVRNICKSSAGIYGEQLKTLKMELRNEMTQQIASLSNTLSKFDQKVSKMDAVIDQKIDKLTKVCLLK